MRIGKVEDRLFEVVSSRTVDVDAIQGNLQLLEDAGILAFGDQTSRILQPNFKAVQGLNVTMACKFHAQKKSLKK